MVNWDALDADADEDTRQAGGLGSLTSLYEVLKLAYLQPDDKILTLPHLCASAAWGRVAVALDSTVFVFGEGCSTLLMQLSIDAIIDIILWVPQGEFLILGDGNGSIHCVHVASQKLLLTKKMPFQSTNEKLFVGGGSDQAEDGKVSLTLVTALGYVVGMKNFDPEAFSDGLRNGDPEQLRSLEAQMTLSLDNMDIGNAQLNTAECIMTGSDSLWVWCGTDKGSCLWMQSSLHDPGCPLTWEAPRSSSVTKVIQIFEGRYILTLDNSGKLSVICVVTGMTEWESTDKDLPVLDAVFLQGDGDNAQLFVIHKPRHSGSSKGCVLQILAFPGFKPIYEVNVNENTILVQTGEGMESVMFVEPDVDPDDEEVVASLKVKSIVDGIPEARLAKLLRKHKFVEAKEFCQTFSLDIEEVNKAHARYLCDCMNPWKISATSATLNETDVSKDRTEELLTVLGNIRDAGFVTSLCVEAPFQDIVTTKKMLNYAKERLATTTKSEEGDQLGHMMQRVSETTYRLCTFETIFPSSDIQHWLAFSSTDMLEEFLVHQRMENLDVASTVWHRHLYEFLDRIDVHSVTEILAAFPHNVPSSVFCNWLPRNVISDLVKLCPDSMELIAMWGDKRVKNLEILEKASWPSNGLMLAEIIISVLENVVTDFHAGGNIEVQMAVHVAQWKAHSPSSALYHLRQTSLALQDLKILAEKFRVKIAFSQYTQENKAAVVGALLEWLVCGEEVAPLVDGFLRSYFIRYGLDCDETLAGFITDTLASADQDWWVWQEAQWEDKVYAVINVITDVQVRAQCIVECIHVAPVPWSEGTKAMCDFGLSLNTSLSPQLEDQRRLVGLKLILRRYSLQPSHLDNLQYGEIILRKIVSRDGDSVMEDALQVVGIYKHLSRIDAYYWRAVHLLTAGNADELKKLIHGVDEKLQRVLCNKMTAFIKQVLLYHPKTASCKEKRKAVTGSVLALELLMKKWCPATNPFHVDEEDFFSVIRNIDTMQVKYEVYPTLHELKDKHAIRKIFEEYATNWYMNFINQINVQGEHEIAASRAGSITGQSVASERGVTESVKSCADTNNFHSLQYLAYLLGVHREDVYFILGNLASKNGRFEEAVKLCQMIMEDTLITEHTTVVVEVLKVAVESQLFHLNNPAASSLYMNNSTLMEQNSNIKCHTDLNNVIYELVSSALVLCCPDQIVSLLEIGQWCQLGSTLYSQCHVEGIYMQGYAVDSSDPYNKWKFTPLYIDASMPIENGPVTSVLAEAFQAWLTSQTKKTGSNAYPYSDSGADVNGTLESVHLTNCLCSLMNHLRERGHDVLAICISLKLTPPMKSSESACSTSGTHGYQQILNILFKIIGGKKPDIPFAVSLLTLLHKKEALKALNELIKRFGVEYTKLLSVATAGKDFCTLNGLREVGEQFSVMHKRSSWGKRLSEFSISYKEAFKNAKAVGKVLSDLLAHPECPFSLVYEYCEDFDLDITEARILYLRTTLHSWSPEPPSEEVRPGALVQVEPPRQIFSKCQAIIDEISNQSHLQEMLIGELDGLSSYNYELLKLIMEQLILLEVNEQRRQHLSRGLEVIDFLRVYPRYSPPGDLEIDEWVRSHPQSLCPPKISNYRLPFHNFFRRSKSMIKIVEAELNVSTIDIWLKACQTLKLNADQLCIFASQNTVTATLEQESNGNNKHSSEENAWQVCSGNNSLLENIKNVVGKIKHNELATACANWVVNRLPPGFDKVKAAENCMILAEEWKENCTDSKAAEAYERMNSRYTQLAVEHALHKYGLAEPKYIALTRTPIDLIFALYQHPSLDSLATLSTHSMPDINSCVSDICSVAGFRQVAIQLDLLEKWLPPPESGEALNTDETVTDFKIAFDPVSTSESDSHNDASLSRVIYLLRCCPQNEAVSYLLNRALCKDASVSAAHCLRALRCLLAIADEKTIQKCCGKAVTSIRTFLQTITYVSRLETLGHATNFQQFNNLDKHALVEGLWRSQRHNPQALTLVTDLCRDYKVMTTSLWGAVLTQLTNFLKLGQVDILTLERILLQIKSLSHLWVVPALTTAWTTIINYPFLKASCPISESSLSACVHSIDLLLRHCPVVVLTAPLLKHCTNLDLPVLALAIASADQVESHDIRAMAEKIPQSKLLYRYDKLKQMFSFPRHVEDVIECLKERV